MKKVVRLTESDLIRLVKKVINEQNLFNDPFGDFDTFFYDELNQRIEQFYIGKRSIRLDLLYYMYEINDEQKQEIQNQAKNLIMEDVVPDLYNEVLKRRDNLLEKNVPRTEIENELLKMIDEQIEISIVIYNFITVREMGLKEKHRPETFPRYGEL